VSDFLTNKLNLNNWNWYHYNLHGTCYPLFASWTV